MALGKLERQESPLSLFAEKKTQSEARVAEWYALQVWSRKESSVLAHLQGLGFECFLPTYKVQRKWSDRVKELEQPLFPGYLFSKFDFQNRRSLVMAPGVVQVVGNGNTPSPVALEEIERLQMAMASEAPRQPWPFMEAGQRVLVNYGSLRDVEGILINFKGSHRVVLSVSLLQRSVAVEVDLAWVTAIEPATHCSAAKAFGERVVSMAASPY
jgi:transcription antitermination factor NusG